VQTRPFFFAAFSFLPGLKTKHPVSLQIVALTSLEDTMFADLVSDSEWSNHSHRGWTTLVSFVVQALALGCLLLLPLFYTDGLPKLAMLAPLLAPAPPPAAPPVPPHPISSSTPQSNLMGNRLISPLQIPPTVTILTDVAPPAPMVDPYAVGVSHVIGDPHTRGSVIGGIGDSNVALPPPAPTVHHPPTSHMMEGNLIYRVQPEYPALARQVRVQGLVVLRAMISRDGAIENLQVLSGHPLLIPSALNAVRQWRYRPYVLNGEPVEVETEVKVNFILSGG
jgi:periplasmic protein TonB